MTNVVCWMQWKNSKKNHFYYSKTVKFRNVEFLTYLKTKYKNDKIYKYNQI